jgi:hypothetical protein
MSTSTSNQPVTVESVFHHDVVQYREYKLLLRPDRFGERELRGRRVPERWEGREAAGK